MGRRMVASAIAIRHAYVPSLSGDPGLGRLHVIFLLALALATSVAGQWFLPGGLGALPNLTLGLAALGLLLVGKGSLRPIPRRLRPMVALTLGLVIWGLVVSLCSSDPATSLRYWARCCLYLVFGVALLGAVLSQKGRAPIEVTVLGFLMLLALIGMLETALPRLAVFAWFRTPHSLTIQPRVASLLSSPNTLGALMVVGVALGESLREARRIAPDVSTLATTLFVFLAAQSGSRNAWMALCVTVALLGIRRLLSPLRGLFVLALFGLGLACLPISRFQLGFADASSLPVSAEHARSGKAPTSLAEPLQSLSLRGALWREGLIRWQNRPWLGLGPGVFSMDVAPSLPGNRRNQNMHSLPLSLLVELGWPGLLASITWVSMILRRAPRGHVAIVPMMVMIVVQVFDDFLYDPSFGLVFLSMSASLTASTARGSDPAGSEP